MGSYLNPNLASLLNTMTFNASEFFTFCPVLGDMIRANSLVGRNGKRFNGLVGLSTLNNLVTLRQLALDVKAHQTLEVGLCFGGSCLVFTASHRDLGASPLGQHVALDPFQQTVWDDTGLAAVEQAGLMGYLDFRPHFSSLELPSLIREGRKFDLVYIDGSHLFEDVFLDFFFISRLLTDRGIMAFDDSSNPHVAKVLGFIRRNCSHAFCEFDLGPYRTDKGRSFKYRLAKLVGKSQLTAFRKIGPPIRKWNSTFVDF